MARPKTSRPTVAELEVCQVLGVTPPSRTGNGRLAGCLTFGLVLSLALGSFVSSRAGVEPTSHQASPKSQVQGEPLDPLPPGAIQRFGTEWFRAKGYFKIVDFSDDGRLMFVKSDERLTIFDRESGRRVKNVRLNPSIEWVGEIAASPDGKFLAVATSFEHNQGKPGSFRIVVVSGTTTRRLTFPWPDRRGAPDFLIISADNKTLVAGNAGNGLRFWNLETGEDIPKATLSEMKIRAGALAPDGQTLVLAGDKKLLMWNWLADDAPREIDPLLGAGAVTAKFSPNGKWFAIGYSTVNGLRVFDGATGEFAWQLDTGGKLMQADGGIAFTSDSQFIAVPVLQAHVVELWNLETRTRAHSFETRYPSAVAISRDDRWLVAGGRHTRLDLWNLATRERVSENREGHAFGITAMRFSPDGQVLASAGDEGAVQLWNVETGDPTHKLMHESGRFVRGLAFSPDGRLLVLSAFDNTLEVWDRASGRRLSTLSGHGPLGASRDVQFTPDGSRFASWGDKERRLSWWNVSDGKHLATHTITTPDPLPVGQVLAEELLARGQFSSDARTLLIKCFGKLFEFDASTGLLRRPIPTLHYVRDFSMSPDRQWLATVENLPPDPNGDIPTEYLLVVRNLATLQVSHQFADARRWSNQTIAFSPDSRLLAFLGKHDSPRIDIVDLQTGILTARIDGAPQCTALQFSPNSRFLASAHDNTTIMLWDLAKLRVMSTK